MRQCGKAFEWAKVDKDEFGNVHYQHAKNKARADLVFAKGAKRFPTVRKRMSCSTTLSEQKHMADVVVFTTIRSGLRSYPLISVLVQLAR